MNLPLGIERDLEPSVARLPLEPGDSLLVFSDGLTEQENPGGEEFGVRRLSATAAGSAAAGRSLAETVPEAVDAWRGRTPQQDDMSFMLLSQVADRE
jgi:serine phosphatase RsbU (regulator of sigma subunit)